MLHPIHGRPLVAWTVAAALECAGARVVVATDDERIAAAAEAAGAEALMTAPDLPSGTDRVAAAARSLSWPGPVLNWQGDEPLLRAADALAAVSLLDRFAVGTLAAPFVGDPADPNRVKVARAAVGAALDFSRSPLPAADPLEHVGVYAYTPAALTAWVAAPPSPREQAEGLEQLRALEMGLTLGVALIAAAPAGVNVPADLERVAPLLGN